MKRELVEYGHLVLRGHHGVVNLSLMQQLTFAMGHYQFVLRTTILLENS